MGIAYEIVNKCLNITKKDSVTIHLYPHNIPLAEEIAAECFKKGADVLLNLYTEKYLLSYMKQLPVESLREPSVFCRALTESSTVEIWAGSTYDPAILKEIPPEKDAAASQGEAKAHWPLQRDRGVRTLAVGISLVSKPRAEAYGFDLKDWRAVMMDASSVDHGELAEKGRKLKSALSKAKKFRVIAFIEPRGDICAPAPVHYPIETDLSFEVSGRRWFVSDGVVDSKDVKEGQLDDHIPAGNVYTAPLEDSVEGVVKFNVKEPFRGESIGNLRWVFKRGKVVAFEGDNTITRLKQDWDQAGGDKDRLAYFSIGFNPVAKTGFTINQVASGAVSIGIGGNEDLGGINKPGFFYAGTLTRATVTADGKAIVENGKIVL